MFVYIRAGSFILFLGTYTFLPVTLWEFNTHLNPMQLITEGGGAETHTVQSAVFLSRWEPRVWQDLFLGQEGLVVIAIDNQRECEEEGIATGLS